MNTKSSAIFLIASILLFFWGKSKAHTDDELVLPIIDGVQIPYNPEFPTAAEGFSNIDGCSHVPDKPYESAPFHAACDNHDRCWRTVGIDAQFCNDVFLKEMLESCGPILTTPIVHEFIYSVTRFSPGSLLFGFHSVMPIQAIEFAFITVADYATVISGGLGPIQQHYTTAMTEIAEDAVEGMSSTSGSGGGSWGGWGIPLPFATRSTSNQTMHEIWNNGKEAILIRDQDHKKVSKRTQDKIINTLVSIGHLPIDEAACFVSANLYKSGVDAAIPTHFPETQDKARKYDAWVKTYVQSVKMIPIIHSILYE